MNDTDYMKKALALAGRGRGTTSPNPMVGAVVVKDGRLVGQGFHEAPGKPHAEALAIEDAGPDAVGATLYVTLEPCNHAGKTPPCTEAILSSGVSRVVVATPDPNPHVTGGGISRLTAEGLPVRVGVCEAQARGLNEVFVKHVTTDRPFVLLKCAATLDGRIATTSGDSRWVSSDASRHFVHTLRHAYDGILVGIKTVLHDNPRLTARARPGKDRDPVRIVLDTDLRIPENAAILNLDSDAETLIICGELKNRDKIRRLQRPGVECIAVGRSSDGVDLKAMLRLLGKRSITSVMVEGGAEIAGSAFRNHVVDKVCFFYAPRILGGDGIPICRGPGPERMADCTPLRAMTLHRIGTDIMVEGCISSFAHPWDMSLINFNTKPV
jgi:diaminohydroxyphosphoribosylaminopyrimidine deaminase/5-amino-6-(5-phosphoribosylamino)uracil reductase